MCQLLGENSADATDGWVGEEKRGGQFFPQIDPLVLIISLLSSFLKATYLFTL